MEQENSKKVLDKALKNVNQSEATLAKITIKNGL